MSSTGVSFKKVDIKRVDIDGIPVDNLPSVEAMLDRIVEDIKHPEQARIYSINVHGCNMANQNSAFRKSLSTADTMLCDGMGTKLASKLLPSETIPIRLAAGDYMPALLERLAEEKLTAYFLAGEPGVAETALANLTKQVPQHTVVGCHHGYILKDKALESQVIEQINALQPDILFVGFGMPLQEFWIEENMHRLNVKAFLPFGATLDYLSAKVQRCPTWLGNLGLEWMFRFCLEPQRMFKRYIVGNPEFLARVTVKSAQLRLSTLTSKTPLSPEYLV